MDCPTVQELISASIDGEATLAERVALDAHLAGCAACRTYDERLSSLNRRVRLRMPHDVPDLSVPVRSWSPRW